MTYAFNTYSGRYEVFMSKSDLEHTMSRYSCYIDLTESEVRKATASKLQSLFGWDWEYLCGYSTFDLICDYNYFIASK